MSAIYEFPETSRTRGALHILTAAADLAISLTFDSLVHGLHRQKWDAHRDCYAGE